MGVRDSISPYIENNGDMINFFAEYYNNGVSVDKIVNDINNNKFKELRVFDLSRFRIFLDSCLMVFNKEKLEKEYFKKILNTLNLRRIYLDLIFKNTSKQSNKMI
ncbi:hypothetical protein B7703_05450 [Streptococcus mitis]|uniref:hypothetical protein n=1 Tax=Streptococcus mitis TaxID=28037 RepID=UPI000A0FB2EE|nr:hypothetical protein [Streptococcus mitis]ORO86899.1 hypothetical protein B7703_05450 [Streptococcus mitis]